MGSAGNLYGQTIYTWVDEKGETHYGDAPPISASTEEVRIDAAPSDPGKPLPRLGTVDTVSDVADSDEPGPVKADSTSPNKDQPDQEMTAEQAKDICHQAHYTIKVLNKSKRRSRVRNPDGSTRAMNKEERDSQRTQAKQDIAEYC